MHTQTRGSWWISTCRTQKPLSVRSKKRETAKFHAKKLRPAVLKPTTQEKSKSPTGSAQRGASHGQLSPASAEGKGVTPGDPRAACGGLAEEGIPETRAGNPSSEAGCVPQTPRGPVHETHMMYSSLFSSVTRMLSPPSFSSWVVTLPRISMSWMKYSSRPHSSRLFSLGA